MNKVLLSLICLIPIVSIAQTATDLRKAEDGRFYYIEKVVIDSISKNQLYLNSKKVFSNAFKTSDYRIQKDDNKEALIIGTGFNDISFRYRNVETKQKIWFTIKIQSQNGFYIFNIYDIYCKSYENGTGLNRPSTEPSFDRFSFYSSAIESNIQNIIQQIKTIMQEVDNNSTTI